MGGFNMLLLPLSLVSSHHYMRSIQFIYTTTTFHPSLPLPSISPPPYVFTTTLPSIHPSSHLPLLPLLLPLPLQLLHMLLMITNLLPIRRNVALAMTSKVLTPSALSLFLLLELFLLCGFDLFRGARCVFFDAQGGCSHEGAARGER